MMICSGCGHQSLPPLPGMKGAIFCSRVGRWVQVIEGERLVHGLSGGRAVCRQPGMPAEWPAKHWWSAKREDINCDSCLLVLAGLDTWPAGEEPPP